MRVRGLLAYSVERISKRIGAGWPGAVLRISVLALLFAGACARAGAERSGLTPIAGLASADLSAGERLRVVATTTLVGDVVGQVGQDDIELAVLLEPGADPHTYQSTPRALAAVADAHLVVINGFGLEEAMLDDLLQASAAPVISLSEGINPRALAEGEEAGQGVDPHVWFDPTNVQTWARNAADALAALEPDREDGFQANAAAYIDELAALDAWIFEQVALISAGARVMVTDHDELGYFADRYGFEIVGAVVPAYSTAADPSAADLAALLETIAAADVRAVFVGVTVNPAVAARISEDAGIWLVVLHTGSLSEPGGPAATYLDLMRTDVLAIVEALREE